MARRPPSRDKVVGLFDRGAQEKRIERILERAVQQRLKQTQRSLVRSGNTPKGIARSMGKKGGRAVRKALVEALKGSLSRQGPGDTGSSRPSARQSAPDGGGRSFHFQVYSVSKDAIPTTAPGKAGGPGAGAAHHAYIEREAALEAFYEPGGPGASFAVAKGRTFDEVKALREAEGKLVGGPDKSAGKDRDGVGHERGDGGAAMEGDGPGKARAAQAYIENPVKLRNGEVILNSFGTIGDTFDERLAFWDLLEANERKADARVQNRIICELPHQSTPLARNEILRAFVKPWDEKGIPYHVAVHAPGPDNDGRNFHAHIVFSERPAKRMPHPETGVMTWDFAVVTTYKNSSRHIKETRPFRQDKLREFGARDFIAGERRRFAEAVNAGMRGIDDTVRFDPRSYKDMGLDVTPMKSVSRIIKDRMKAGRSVVLDAAWTKRMVEAELEQLARNRDGDLKRMVELTARIEATKKDYPRIGKVNERLPLRDRIVPGALIPRNVLNKYLDKRLDIEMERMERRVVARAEEAACERIIAATNPAKTAATVRAEDPMAFLARGKLKATVDADGIAALHEAAKAELAAVRAELKASDLKLRQTAVIVGDAWRKVAGTPFGPLPGPPPEEPKAARRPIVAPPAKLRLAETELDNAALAKEPAGKPAPAAEAPRHREMYLGVAGLTLPAMTGREKPAQEGPPKGHRPGDPYMNAKGEWVHTSPLAIMISEAMKGMYDGAKTGAALMADLKEKHGIESEGESWPINDEARTAEQAMMAALGLVPKEDARKDQVRPGVAPAPPGTDRREPGPTMRGSTPPPGSLPGAPASARDVRPGVAPTPSAERRDAGPARGEPAPMQGPRPEPAPKVERATRQPEATARAKPADGVPLEAGSTRQAEPIRADPIRHAERTPSLGALRLSIEGGATDPGRTEVPTPALERRDPRPVEREPAPVQDPFPAPAPKIDRASPQPEAAGRAPVGEIPREAGASRQAEPIRADRIQGAPVRNVERTLSTEEPRPSVGPTDSGRTAPPMLTKVGPPAPEPEAEGSRGVGRQRQAIMPPGTAEVTDGTVSTAEASIASTGVVADADPSTEELEAVAKKKAKAAKAAALARKEKERRRAAFRNKGRDGR